MTNDTTTNPGRFADVWHVQCLVCDHRYHWADGAHVVHSQGYDWEDTSDFCPSCGQPNDVSFGASPNYRMHDGPVPR